MDPETSADELEALLRFDPDVRPRESRINRFRDELIGFIQANPDKLSMSCHGRCYEHEDAIVLHCYRLFVTE